MADAADLNTEVAPSTGRDNAKIPQTAEELEQLLDELGEVERFDPPPEFRARARITDPGVYAAAARDLEAYWAGRARELHWDAPFTQVLDESKAPFVTWFADGTLNVSYNCLDRHIEAGLGERVAYRWRGEEGEERDITYADLHQDVQRLANGLKDLGVGQGDVVGIFLPMIPEVVVAMLACARIGAPHNVVFGGFAPDSVRERMEVSHAKALITVDGARRKGKTATIKQEVDRVMSGLTELRSIVVVRHTGTDCAMQDGRDVFYDELLARSEPVCPAEPLPSEHPLFILYSSGSTAKPKGILHTAGGYLTGVAATHRDVFDLRPDSDVFWCTADVGWVTGHSYIVYGPLANGCTSVMFEGAPDFPAKDVWWEIIERYGVTIFYTAPTAIRVCMKWGVEYPNKHDMSSLRLLGSVGEPINPKAWLWFYAVVGHQQCPVVDTWWQTETGQIMIAPLPGLTATKPGSATHPLPGISAALVDIDGNELDEGTGLLVLTRPWPGMLRTLVGDDERFVSTYFERFGSRTYVVGDAARKDGDGYFWIIGRTDDVINVSGHRLSTAEVESAIVAHAKVAEAAVVAEADALSGQAIVAFVTLNAGLQGDDRVAAEIRAYVGERIGKLARPKSIIWAGDLPKTRSGKIMRRLLRDIAEGHELGDVTTLGDPSILRGLQEKAADRGTTTT